MKVFRTGQGYLRGCARTWRVTPVPAAVGSISVISDSCCELIGNDVTKNSTKGVQQINIYGSETKNLEKALISEVSALGLPVCGDVSDHTLPI
jgi:hypothetical protein